MDWYKDLTKQILDDLQRAQLTAMIAILFVVIMIAVTLCCCWKMTTNKSDGDHETDIERDDDTEVIDGELEVSLFAPQPQPTPKQYSISHQEIAPVPIFLDQKKEQPTNQQHSVSHLTAQIASCNNTINE